MKPKHKGAELLRKHLSCLLAVVMTCGVLLGTVGCSPQDPAGSIETTTPETSLDAEKEALEELQEQLAEMIAQNQELLNQMLTTKAEIQEMLDEAERRKDEIASKIEELKELQSKQWHKPVAYTYLSSPFGYRWHPIYGDWRFHYGVDLAAPKNTPIVASRSGKIKVASYQAGGAGYYVNIDHGDGYLSVYMHMTKYIVSPGQYVVAGQVIGYCGATGAATGYHLHFGIYYNGTAVNPADYISF